MTILVMTVAVMALVAFGSVMLWLRWHESYETPEAKRWRQLREWGHKTVRELGSPR